MNRVLGFCLLLAVAGCTPDSPSNTKWDGTYIGYFHHNQQDTIPLTIVFEGKYFAASPYGKEADEAAGVFLEDRSGLVFHNTTDASSVALHGPFRFQFGMDGSVRIWQHAGDGINEMILRHK